MKVDFYYKVLVVLGIILIAGLVCWTFGWYPIVVVDKWHPIYAHDFNKTLEITLAYYRDVLKFRVDNEENFKLVALMVINGLVDDVAITKKLKEEMGGKNLKSKINQRSENFFSEKAVLEWIKENHFSKKDFQKHFLEPMIKRELLESQLSLEQKDFSSWFQSTRSNYKIWIFSSRLRWSGDEIELK